MKLSRVERLILANQYRILEALYPDEAESYANRREAIENGYEMHYRWQAEHIYDGDDVMTEEESREVLDILDMFAALKRSQSLVADDASVESWHLTFSGFDGNNETKQMAYARYFCGLNGGRYTELDRGDNFNSHMPSLERYRRQLREWRKSADPHSLTKEDVIRIAAAAPYPQ